MIAAPTAIKAAPPEMIVEEAPEAGMAFLQAIIGQQNLCAEVVLRAPRAMGVGKRDSLLSLSTASSLVGTAAADSGARDVESAKEKELASSVCDGLRERR